MMDKIRIENSKRYQMAYQRGYVQGQNNMLKYLERELRNAYLQRPIVLKILNGEKRNEKNITAN